MTASHLVQLICESQQASGCQKVYPPVPAAGAVLALRAEAAERGWEVMRGKYGRDACPRCRIAEITRAGASVAREADV